jgi:hypothetical protein
MKFSSTVAIALALLACSAYAQEPSAETASAWSAIDPVVLVDALEAAGPDTEFTVLTLPNVANTKSIIAADKVTLSLLPAAGPRNQEARAIFSFLATDNAIVWKLSLVDIVGFTGAHLHLNTPAGPIVQHLVPEISEGDFIPPVNIPKSGRVYVGTFGVSELEQTLGVRSIRQFIREFVSRNEIYINVHGPGNAAILKGFLNA